MAVRKKKNATNEIFLLDALKDLCSEKEISIDLMFDAIEAALIFACKKTLGADKNISVEINRENGDFHIRELREIVENVTKPATEISLEDAQKINPNFQIGEFVAKELSTAGFGRIAAQAAKQVVTQKIREAERIMVYDEFTDRANDVVNGNIVRIEDGNAIIDIGKTEAILTASEQMPADNFKVGDRVKAYVAEVRKIGKGPQVYLSRTHPGFLRRLFELEVPEIQEKIVLVKFIAREAGMRSKVAVVSNDEDVDAVGSCVGQHGIRIQAIVDELGDEKIDIVQWDADPAIFIANALSPSKVIRVSVNEPDKVSRVVVPNNQLSLAIGKEGQNARLAAKLTGWKIDIKSKMQAKGDVLNEEFRTVKIKPVKFFSSTLKAKQPKNNPEKNSENNE
ncbi:MAG: transcription termination/antitermination protein NusA [Selenomonadaceae bacterium]|nr:transcription termination/antitermination protein NusA [Selenomonadaceae bacterium]